MRGVDTPAILLELKWNQSADTAIAQIKRQEYAGALSAFAGEVLLVGINYNKKTKKHECRIEKITDDKPTINDNKPTITDDKKSAILSYLNEHQSARTEELAQYIHLSTSQTKEYLYRLVDQGLVVRHGANRNRTYSLASGK